MKSNKNITHLTSLHPRYDVRIYHKMCKSLAHHGYQVTLVVADGKGNENSGGVKIHDIGNFGKARLSRIIMSSVAMFNYSRKLNSDIFHLHDPELIFIGILLKLKGCKVIFDSHEDIPKDLLDKEYLNPIIRKFFSFFFTIIEKNIFKFFTYVVTSTSFIESRFLSYGVKSIAIKNYPILSEYIQYSSLESNAICYIGGISPNRGIEELVDALALIENVKLIIAGNFSDVEFESRMKSKKNWDKIDYRGYVDRNGVMNVLKESSIGILTLYPTHNYLLSLPIKMFEYMASGLPLLISNFPFWEEIVIDNNCGVSVNPLDPKAIADAIVMLLSDRARLKQMGSNGQELVSSNLNWSIEEKKLIELYQSILV